jgi:hypothetical protein
MGFGKGKCYNHKAKTQYIMWLDKLQAHSNEELCLWKCYVGQDYDPFTTRAMENWHNELQQPYW